MEILSTNKYFWISYGTFLTDRPTIYEQIASILLNIYYISCESIIFVGSVGFILYAGVSGDQLIYTYQQIFANSFLLFNYFVFCTRKNALYKLSEKIKAIVGSRYNAGSFDIYDKAEKQASMLTKWLFTVYMASYDGGLILMTVVSFVYDKMRGEYDVLKWPNIVHMRCDLIEANRTKNY